MAALKTRDQLDLAILKKLRKRVSRARHFPVNTCPASRHLAIMADCLSKGKRAYPMLNEEPLHCAITMYAVVAALWEERTKRIKRETRKCVRT